MKELLEASDIDYNKLKRKVHTIAATELSGLSEPCYYPSLKKYYFELLHICGLKQNDVKEFVKRFYKGTPAAKWKLHRDPISNFYIFLMYVLIKKNDILAYKSAMVFFVIRNYTNLINKQIQYCNKDVFRYTLENLAKTHLFVREKSIPGALHFMSKEMDKKYRVPIEKESVKGVSEFITACRTRISQSIKSFAEVYYRASKEGYGIREPYEGEEGDEQQIQQIERTSRLISDVVRKITIYRVVDQKAVDDARALTKIRASLAVMISNGIRNTKYTDNIKLILELFVKDLSGVPELCGPEFITYVRSLMAVKRTKARVYFKQQVQILLELVIKDLKYQKEFNKLTSQTRSLINLFLAYYLTMVMRNTIC